MPSTLKMKSSKKSRLPTLAIAPIELMSAANSAKSLGVLNQPEQPPEAKRAK